MVISNYTLGDFASSSPVEIAARFPYGQVKILLDIARGIPEGQRGRESGQEIANLEGALIICNGEFIQGARNIH